MSRKPFKNCPDSDDLVRAFLEATDTGAGHQLIEHARRCPRCRPRIQVLTKVKAALEARAAAVPETRLSRQEARALRRLAVEQTRLVKLDRPLSFRPLPLAAAAGVAVIALALGYLYLSDALRSRLTVRGPINQELRLLVPGAHLREAPADFSWTDIPGRDKFRFVLIDEHLDTIFERETHRTGLRLPEDERQKLVKGESYLWTVLVLDGNDKEMASVSGEFEIE
jgi:hypothetical protein